MLLAIDIGNSEVTVGLFKEKELKGEWRVSSDLDKTPDEYGILISALLKSNGFTSTRISGVILSSVVPRLTSVFQNISEKYFSIMVPMQVTHRLETGLNIQYDRPEEIGVDRIVNATAAYHLYGGPVVIVDLGTATTFCVVSEKGEYLGGAIAPGLNLSLEALYSHAAKLPRIKIAKPSCVIGKDTHSSVQSGSVFGYVGLIDGMVRRIHHEIGSKAHVIGTGGLAKLIASECETISHVRQTLTLEGLMIIYGMNRNS
ncbi:MAG: type III pantothenate kinase [Nitrospiria bacterium]